MAINPPPPANKNARSHLVLLGAGASRAGCPGGDKNGVRLPVFADFIETLKLRPKLEAAGVCVTGENFESLYSRLTFAGTDPDLLADLETQVFNYFTELRLPDEPTVYDHLLLSLRDKDVVATFNWDPFLVQAVGRCRKLAKPPLCLHLHGNVAIGYCDRHKPITLGVRGRRCQRCDEPLVDTRLMYPVTKKDYSADPLLSKFWQSVQTALKDAFLFTIFGYSAPTTDVEAVDLLKAGWGDSTARQMEQFKIIDLRPEDDLCKTWKSFIHTHHYDVHTSFYDSMIGQLPRRSVEMMVRELIDAELIDAFPIAKGADWDRLSKWIQPFLDGE